MKAFKDRPLPELGEPVEAYRNLHKDQWSIRALSGPNKGKVIAHAPAVSLIKVSFKISEAGRQRVIREQAKNVHATAQGAYAGDSSLRSPNYEHYERVSYNPYQRDHFVVKSTGKRVEYCEGMLLAEDGKAYGFDPHSARPQYLP